MIIWASIRAVNLSQPETTLPGWAMSRLHSRPVLGTIPADSSLRLGQQQPT